MAKLNSLFRRFLSNIEPDADAVGYAQEAHEPVRDALADDEKFGQYVEDTFLYGSYKRHTAVGDIKDVDIVVLTNFDLSDPKNTPSSVLRKLKEALARHYKDPENPEYQRRSIRINDPLPNRQDVEMTLDIIPAVAENGDDQPLKVPDREVKEWIESHPKGHIAYTTALNHEDFSGGRFVPLAKMMKWWWKYQCEVRQPDVERPKPKGFWAESLTGETFDRTQEDWADHFIAVLATIKAKYENVTESPALRDPGLPEQTIKTNMTLEEFQVFMTAVTECLATAITARDEEDELKSSVLWRDIFGEEFPLYEVEETQKSTAIIVRPVLGDTRHALRPDWTENLNPKKRKVRIDAYVYKGNEIQGGINSDETVLDDGLNIKFVAKVTNVREPYQVYWQVVNTGRHASSDNGLRGDFMVGRNRDNTPSADPLTNWESTKYTGKHWIQCFIVQNRLCVAKSKKFYVNVRNAQFMA